MPAALLVTLLTLGPGAATSQVPPFETVAVGVRYDPDPDPARRKTDLENMRRLRFTVVVLSQAQPAETQILTSIERLIAGDAAGSLTAASAQIGRVQVEPQTPAAHVREAAWTQFASGLSCVIFDDWRRLQQNDAALGEAATFADMLARNPALYTSLQKVETRDGRAITIEGGSEIKAGWLESADALLLIAINHSATAREVTLTFPPEIPEAVWQNMLTGAAVNFVAGAAGPIYQRTFPPHDVLVLMIRKRWK